MWGDLVVGWEFQPAINTTGGLLCIWNEQVFQVERRVSGRERESEREQERERERASERERNTGWESERREVSEGDRQCLRLDIWGKASLWSG